MQEGNVRISLLPADKDLLLALGRRARDIGSFVSPDDLLIARYIENLLVRIVTPILTEGALAKATKAETIVRLHREIGEAAIVIAPAEIKLRLLAYLLPLTGGDAQDSELLRGLLFPRDRN